MKKQTGLTITKSKQKQTLSPSQKTFNRLSKKIEKLQVLLKTTAYTLDEKLKFYAAEILPLEQELIAMQTMLAKVIFVYYKKEGHFSKKEKTLLKSYLEMLLNEIFPKTNNPDEALKEIFEAIHNVKFENAAEESFRYLKDDIEKTFGDLGIIVNMDGLKKGMTEDEIMATIYEQLAKNKDNDLFQNATRAKTNAQKETEALELKTEEAKNKSISSIYRQLAKIIHPDLEADETIKLEKEELMKQLTAAYENNDLHTLLSLEIQWIQKEENQLSALTDEKLKTYNKIMEEQAEDLKNEIIMLENHPRYNALRHIEDFPGQLRSIDLEGEKEYIQEELKEITANLANLNKSESTAVKAIKKIIKHYAEETNGEDDLMELASMFEQVIQYGRSKKTK